MRVPEYLYEKLNGFEVTVYDTRQKTKLFISKHIKKISLYNNLLVLNRETDYVHIFNADVYVIPNSMKKYINRSVIINDLDD